MSETTSSPSVHPHPISPSSESSLSSADSAPRSEPTSDEQPDLGAFTAVLREWTHLQPPPRIPVQIRSATSSTTPTFQPDQSVAGSDYNVGRGRRRNSRTSNRSGLSTLSSFTRPASSSIQPEGSTVWNQALIASYLNSTTPSNDMISEEDEGSEGLREADFTPSPPPSRASTALTVEITSEVDFPSFAGSRDSSRNQDDYSPYPYHVDPGISLLVPLETDGQRLDSRENAHRDEELEEGSLGLNVSHEQDTSLTSRDFTHQDGPYSETSSLQSHSRYQSQAELTSIQLQSQAHPSTTIATSPTESLSFPNQDPTSSAVFSLNSSSSVPQKSTSLSNNDSGSAHSSASTSTFITALLNRSRNPLPPRTTSDSSVVSTGSALSSNFSLVSYQIPETPSITNDEEDNPDTSVAQGYSVLRSHPSHPPAVTHQSASPNTSFPSTSAASGSLSLKTQNSIDSTTSGGSRINFAPAFEEQAQSNLLPSFHPFRPSHISSLSSDEPPLPNPYSPIPPQRRDRPAEAGSTRPSLTNNVRNRSAVNDFDIVNDLGTPGEQISESEIFNTLRRTTRTDVLPVDDVEEDEVSSELRREVDQLRQARATQRSSEQHSSIYDPSPSSVRGRPAQRRLVSEQILHVEPQLEDDEDEDEEDSSYQYTYSRTPGSYSQAVTPKGFPAHADPAKQSIATQAHPLSRTLEHFSQSFSQRDVLSQASHNLYSNVQQEPEVQHLSPPMPSHKQSMQSLIQPTSRTIGQSQMPSHAQSTAQFPTQPSHLSSYLFTPTRSSVIQSYTSTQSTSANQTHQDNHDRHRYPHSLLGLHALPASLISPDPEDLPIFDPNTSSFSTRMAQPLVETDSTSDTITLAEDVSDQPLPSLGYLDEALSFIAAERDRWHAARQSAADAVSDSQVAEGGGSDDEVEALEGGAELPHVIDNELDHPKRKRRRKRPTRSHGLTPGATASGIVDFPATSFKAEGLPDNSVSAQLTHGSSPKKKRRSKSASASTSSRSLLLDSPSKSKAKNRAQDKEFLVAPQTTSAKDGPPVTILRRPMEGDLLDKDDIKTPTHGTDFISRTVAESPAEGLLINLVGKKGRRVGRREREREKKKRDTEKEQAVKTDEQTVGEDFDIGIEYDDDDNEDDGVEPQEEDDDQGENDSLSNITLLQPPRRKRDRSRRGRGRDAHIHTLIGVGEIGTYRSTPTTPMKTNFDGAGVAGEMVEDTGQEIKGEMESMPEEDVFVSKPTEAPTVEKKKRVRTKRIKTLAHARSDPQLRFDSDGVALGEDSSEIVSAQPKKGKNKAQAENAIDSSEKCPFSRTFNASSGSASLTNRPAETVPHTFPPESKRGRLLTLAKKLSQLFPEQREELSRVITRIEKQGAAPTTTNKKALSADVAADYGMIKSSLPIAIPGMKRRRSKKGGHYRTGSEGTAGEGHDFDELAEYDAGVREERVRFSGIDEEDEEEIDPRGRPPRKNDVLIHVFIDHSNILIGLLSHFKRHPPQRKIAVRGRPLPAVITKATTSANGTDKSDPAAAFAAVKPTSARPLPVPIQGEASSSKQAITSGNTPIPLPSFATMSRSLPSASVLGALKSGKDPIDEHEREVNSDSHGYTSVDHDDEGAGGPESLFIGSFKSKEKRPPKHLWHAALTLILERGRPITRRVVVTSSPLYQPMESIERLGYELRVFIRVPDLGDGMDRERHRDKDRGGSGKSSGGGKSNQSSPATTTSLSTLAGLAKRARSIGHVRQLSGNTSAESGSGGAGSGNASGGGGGNQSHAVTNNGAPQKIKYREQGVDELLQLKLHQALAATDDVPEGSTIVLATGDGNMGQFNEEGFLGPVRTALRRGWKVELYAWEDGLSRAWRREFGASSEWGRRGMFRIIGMEEFASGLVEAYGWP